MVSRTQQLLDQAACGGPCVALPVVNASSADNASTADNTTSVGQPVLRQELRSPASTAKGRVLLGVGMGQVA